MTCQCAHNMTAHTHGGGRWAGCKKCPCPIFRKKGGEPRCKARGQSPTGSRSRRLPPSTLNPTKSTTELNFTSIEGKPGGFVSNGLPICQAVTNGFCHCLDCGRMGRTTFGLSWTKLGRPEGSRRDLSRISLIISFHCQECGLRQSHSFEGSAWVDGNKPSIPDALPIPSIITTLSAPTDGPANRDSQT